MNFATNVDQKIRAKDHGEHVFAAELTSQPTLNGFGDIHRSLPIGFYIRVFNLPDTIRESCINLVKSLGLRYGAIDFIVDKNNRLVFLEVDPTGDWYWIENKVKLPVTKAMVVLIAGLV
jgi:hypothetical protein